MSERHCSHRREFKQEAVNLFLDGGIGVAPAARDMGVPESALWRWKKSKAIHRENCGARWQSPDSCRA